MTTSRTRSLIIDNTTSSVLTGVVTTSSANAASYLLRNASRTLPIIIKEAGISVQTITATKGWKVYSNTKITQIDMECMKANSTVSNASVYPVNTSYSGNAIIIKVRSISNTGITTTYGNTAITSNNIFSSSVVNYNINANETVYVDVVQVGNTVPGSGLKTTLYYYGG